MGLIFSTYRGLATNGSNTLAGLPAAMGLSRAGTHAQPVPLQSFFPPAELKLREVSLATQRARTDTTSVERRSLCQGLSPRTRR